jgi:bifunctional DNA-binding transcriptional regulator/antitoxin component of YhaV-PrlF toxin-antitoxin module
MPTEKKYRLRKAGSGKTCVSYEITVPLEWVRFLRLNEGDKIKALADGLMIFIPPGRPDLEQKARRFLEGGDSKKY